MCWLHKMKHFKGVADISVTGLVTLEEYWSNSVMFLLPHRSGRSASIKLINEHQQYVTIKTRLPPAALCSRLPPALTRRGSNTPRARLMYNCVLTVGLFKISLSSWESYFGSCYLVTDFIHIMTEFENDSTENEWMSEWTSQIHW